MQAISDAYINFFYNYDQSPLLIVNTVDFDIANNNNNFDTLLKYIQDLSPGQGNDRFPLRLQLVEAPHDGSRNLRGHLGALDRGGIDMLLQVERHLGREHR